MEDSLSKGMHIALLCMIALSYISCHHQEIRGSGNSVTKQVEVNGIRKIRIKGVGDLLLTQAEEENLLIKADDNILPYVISEIKEDELFLGIDGNVSFSPVTPLVFSINIKDISEIEAFGSLNIEIKSLKTQQLNINLKGNTKIYAKIAVKEINVTASGSTKAILDGNADNQTFILKGSNTLDGTNLRGKNAVLNASGSASAKLNVTEKIAGSISGAVKVRYKNNPTIELKTSGASNIKKL